MSCTISGIADKITTEDRTAVKEAVRLIRNMTPLERATLSNTPEAFATRVFGKLDLTLGEKKATLIGIETTSEGKHKVKYQLSGSPVIHEEIAGDLPVLDTGNDTLKMTGEHLDVLFSDFEHINVFDDYEKHALDITNNPERIMEMAEYLIESDEHEEDEAHTRTLRQQISRITGTLIEVVPALAVHINNAGTENAGKIEMPVGDLYISKGVGGAKSLLEVYVHELYHAATHFALSSTSTAVRAITARIEAVRDHFLDNTTEADLIAASGNTLTEEQAGHLIDHLTNPKHGLHEFVAIAMSNKAVMNQLKTLDTTAKKERVKKSLFYRLLDSVKDLFDIIYRKASKEPKGNDFERMVVFVARLQEAHKLPMKARRRTIMRNLISPFAKFDKKFEDFIKRKEKEMKEKPGRNTAKPGEGNLKYLARLGARALFDESAKDNLANALSLMTVRGGSNLASPEGTIRSAARDMRAGDDTQNEVDREGTLSAIIDQRREFTALQTEQVILESFRRPLTEDEQVILTDTVLDTDLQQIYRNDAYDIKGMLGSNGKIDAAVKTITAKLKELTDQSSVNFYEVQAGLLAKYMINQEDHIALLKNARNIAQKLGTSEEQFDVSEEIVELIDDLVSLTALRSVPKAKRAVLQSLMDEDFDGVDHLIGYQQGQVQATQEALFPSATDKINIIKGYSAQITDSDIEIAVAPVDQEKEMKIRGFKLVKEVPKHSLHTTTTPMAMYVSNKFVRQRFHRVGMRMTDKGRRGTSITESYMKQPDEVDVTLEAAADIQKLKDRRVTVIAQMFAGTYDAEATKEDSLVSPILNKVGRVADFSYGLDKDIKKELLNMDRKIGKVMGRTAASAYDKVASAEYNAKIMKMIKKDAAANLKEDQISVIGKNQKEYIKIEKNSANAMVRDFWKILPSDVKREFSKGFTIRRDLMFAYLGYREISIIDFPMLKQFFSKNPKAYKAAIKYAIQFSEKLWQEIIKISKADIIMRTPAVFIGNIVSNFLLMYISGYSFKEITQLKLQGVKELKVYVDGLKESIKLGFKKQAGQASKNELRRLNVIKNKLENSPVKDLVDEGFYTTIIEELEGTTGSGSYFNKLAKDKLKNAPKILSTGIDVLYITENTKVFKLIEKGIQASDFAARYAQYHLMVQDGVAKEKAALTVRDNYINYNKANSQFVEWANQMGFMMFTKYFTRIQRVLHQYGKTHPSKLLLSIIAQEVLFDLDTVDDQSLLVKDMGNLFYSPWDNFMRVITPSSAEAVNWVLNGKS